MGGDGHRDSVGKASRRQAEGQYLFLVSQHSLWLLVSSALLRPWALVSFDPPKLPSVSYHSENRDLSLVGDQLLISPKDW